MPASGTILRASYGRTLETPYNENLVLSSSADAAVFGTGGVPLPPGTRDQFEVGVQQAIRPMACRGRRLLLEAHDQRLRLRRAVRHADLLPGLLGSLEARRHHRPGDARRARGLQRVHGVRPHQRDLLAARHRRHPDGSAAGRRSASITTRSSSRRPTLQYVFDKSARRVGGDLVALRLGPRGRVRPRLRHSAHARRPTSRRRSASSAAARSPPSTAPITSLRRSAIAARRGCAFRRTAPRTT